MNSKEHLRLIKNYLAETYSPLPVILSRGLGVWVWDIKGRQYMDMLSCYSAANAGHCHPRLTTALIRQAIKLDSVSRAFLHDQFGQFLKEAADITGQEKILPMNTGVEGWEKAVKSIRKWAYRIKGIEKYKAEIIVCENNFHGRTITAVSASSEPLYKNDFGPHTPGFRIIPYGDTQSIEKAINKNTAAVILEPIQGEAGIIIPPRGYLSQVKKICQNNNVLYALDEIQTGLGRTGKTFAYQYEDAQPDLLILGKFLGGDLYPVSLVAGPKKVLGIFQPGEDGSTFSGNPIACAVAIEVFKVLMEEKLAERAAEQGQHFLNELKKIKSPYIKEARGRGLLIGLELIAEAGGARKFCQRLMKKGLLCKETHDNVIRFAPPLIIAKSEIDWALERIEKVLKNHSKRD